MRRKRVMRGLMVVALGAMLTVGMSAWGVASAATSRMAMCGARGFARCPTR